MNKRRRIIHADKILQNVVHMFCLLMFLQLKGYYSVASNTLLLYSTASDIRVANISKPNKVTTIIKGLEQGSAVDFLHRKNLICWSDQTEELIQCTNYNGTSAGEKVRIVSEDLITPTGIALDWYTEKIYWTDGETNRIEVISLDTKYRKVLFWTEVDLARAIAIVPSDGLVFWTDWGEVPKIERAGMDGDPATRKVIVKDKITWPNGITIDYTNKLIYWVDAKLQFVDVIDFEGENRRSVVKEGLQYPYALAMFNDKLYWTDWKTWAIDTFDMTTSGPVRELLKSDPVPVDVRVYDGSRQAMPTGDYPCKVNNGGCSHLCLLSPNSPGYICTCPTGVKLKEGSNTTCYNGPQSLVLVAQRSMISKISLDSPDFTPHPIPLKDVKRAITVDFDPKTEFIYWADNMAKSISRARLDGSDQMTIIHHGITGVPESIAVDSLARNIYWTDPTSDTISVARLDGSYQKVVIHDDLYEPRAIALHPTAGLMFWSDWNDKKPKIERASLDGSGRVLLVSEKLAWPNGIALDTVNNKLYWGDARTHKIEVSNMDGTERKELHNSDILHIFGLTLLGDHLYWTDMQRRTLDRINKVTGADRQPVVDQMANMMGLKAFRLGEKQGRNPCVDNNGGCTHLCFNRPHDYVCGCPLGLELISDRKTCVEPEAFLVYSRKNVIGRISIENENNDGILPLKELKEVSALAVHVSGTNIYWSDSKMKTINRCSVNGSNMEKVLEWTGIVEGLAIDWSGENIYWTDTSAQRIEVARLDGSSRRTLVWQGLKKPKSIALDPRKGFMYWSDLGFKSIKRASMDGSSPAVIIEQAGRVNALAIDYESRAIYWAALEPPAIEFAHLDGSGRKKILGDDIPMPYAMTLYNDKVFWGDWTTGDIELVKKTDGSNRQKIHKRLDFISDLKVYHKSRHSGGNQCSVDNGQCSHLCLALPGEDGRADFKCACPTHHKLNRDNLTCSEPEEFLLFAQKNAVGRIMIANGECNDAAIPLSGLKNVKAIDYDPISKLLYWMDDDTHSIRRVAISHSSTSATEATFIVTGLSKPFHLVLDVIGRALYWTCLDSDSINGTSLGNYSLVSVTVKSDNMMPRHLALHQTKRLLIWNDIGLGGIMRANVDGTDRIELAKASNATALTVDQSTGTVYFAMNRQIHAVEIDGKNKRIIWQGGYASSLAIYSGSVYWSGGGGGVQRVPAARRDAPAAPVPHVARVLALRATTQVDRSHPCYGGTVCGGGPGACLADGACGCGPSCPRAPACPPQRFTCALSRPPAPPVCIPLAWRCDSQIDCPDGSDEAPQECGICASGIRCAKNGPCAETLTDCPEGAFCAGAPIPNAFRCDERLCLPPALLCDGKRHCDDGTDESPAACGDVQKEAISVRHSNAFAACGAVAGMVAVCLVAWAALRRWQRAARRRRQRAPSPALRLARGKPRHDRTHSIALSESICERYPRPTINPPPSPATASGTGPVGRRRPARHYRSSTRPPPPTPCSTDAGESDYRAPPPTPDPPHMYLQ
ncbi:low-density lipoprotein receptor-related protein 6 [Plutella xylostella]|uniref:low-density lipoprotein receptor-related protein 6 n=1 Tax=Plutella xylostella TaxID=51655 RepID=UPI00203243CB|nr:low-density lipoprotein receptor-related protein 6 [Plutella xylostella]